MGHDKIAKLCNITSENRPISQIMYQPKNVRKINDFESLTPLYLPKFKSNVYLFLHRVTGYCLYQVKNSISDHLFSKSFITTPCCYGLDVSVKFVCSDQKLQHLLSEQGVVSLCPILSIVSVFGLPVSRLRVFSMNYVFSG